jgi:hypothetical protein
MVQGLPKCEPTRPSFHQTPIDGDKTNEIKFKKVSAKVPWTRILRPCQGNKTLVDLPWTETLRGAVF